MTVTEYILNYDPGIPTVWMVGTYLIVGCAVVALFMYGGSKTEIIKNCSWALLAGYVFLVLCSTIICRDECSKVSYNLNPFLHIHSKNVAIIGERILNILLFVPIGLLTSAVINRRCFIKVMALGFCVSILIEAAQLVLKRGVCNVDDIIHNAIGCLIGYVLYIMIRFGILHKVQ